MKVHVYAPPTVSSSARSALQGLVTGICARGDVGFIQRAGFVNNSADVLLTYGAGGAFQREAIAMYRSRGKRVVTLDLGYWNRAKGEENRCWRWSIDGHQPGRELLLRSGECNEPETAAALTRTRDYWDERGHVLFCLSGRKTQAAFPSMIQEERQLLADASRIYGSRLVIREKPSSSNNPAAPVLPQFDSILRGCALVITHSSNVAIEAAAAGVPFYCLGGVAALDSLPELDSRPRPAKVERVLRRAGFFQISTRMIKQGAAWSRIRSLL